MDQVCTPQIRCPPRPTHPLTQSYSVVRCVLNAKTPHFHAALLQGLGEGALSGGVVRAAHMHAAVRQKQQQEVYAHLHACKPWLGFCAHARGRMGRTSRASCCACRQKPRLPSVSPVTGLASGLGTRPPTSLPSDACVRRWPCIMTCSCDSRRAFWAGRPKKGCWAAVLVLASLRLTVC